MLKDVVTYIFTTVIISRGETFVFMVACYNMTSQMRSSLPNCLWSSINRAQYPVLTSLNTLLVRINSLPTGDVDFKPSEVRADGSNNSNLTCLLRQQHSVSNKCMYKTGSIVIYDRNNSHLPALFPTLGLAVQQVYFFHCILL